MKEPNPLDQIILIMQPTWEKHPNVIFIKDDSCNYRYVNEAFIDLTGFTKNEILGKSGFELFKQDEAADRYHQADLEVLQKGKVQYYETTMERRGKDFHSHTTKSPIYDKENNIIGIFGESRDISQLVNTRIELSINLNLLETLMDTVPYPIFVKNLDHKYIRVNKAFSEELKIPKTELIGVSDTDLYGIDKAELFELKDSEVFQKGRSVVYLTDRINKPNKGKFMIIKEPLLDDKGILTGLVGIINPFVNITEIQQELIEKQKIETLSLLVGGIVHDLNNMLSSVVGVTSIMRYENLSESVSDMVNVIYNSSIDASNLAKKLRSFTNQNQKEITQLALGDQILGIIRLLSSNLSEGIEFVTELPEEEIFMETDQTQISQLLLNLLINAIEAINGKGIIKVKASQIFLETLDITDFLIHPHEFTPGQYVKILVKDSGIGISEDNIKKIFDPFFTTKKSGSGMGLPVVYSVISNHSGFLKIQSRVNEGTCFEIYLPMKYISIEYN